MDLPPEEPKAGAPDWIVTFADLMSLLLTFFVLLLSFSTTEIAKFQEMAGSMRDAFGMNSPLDPSDMPSGQTLLPSNDARHGEGEAEAGLTSEELEAKLQEVLEQTGAAEKGEARLTKHGVVLQISGDLMFESGGSQISSQALVVLEGLANYVKTVDRGIDIVGHTDNVPIATAVYPSNWELSAARAGQAVRFLVEQGVAPERLRAIGQADTVPLVGNDTAEGRGTNRRVEFVFTDQDEGAPEKATIEEMKNE